MLECVVVFWLFRTGIQSNVYFCTLLFCYALTLWIIYVKCISNAFTFLLLYVYSILGFHGSLAVKNLSVIAGDMVTQVQSVGQEDPLVKEMAAHSSVLAWEIPWTEEPGGLQSMGLQRVGHDLMTRKQQTVNSILFCQCTTIYLPIILIVNILIVSRISLLEVILPCTFFVYVSMCKYARIKAFLRKAVDLNWGRFCPPVSEDTFGCQNWEDASGAESYSAQDSPSQQSLIQPEILLVLQLRTFSLRVYLYSTLLLFSFQVVSDSSATPWTVALLGSSVHSISQARRLKWIVISFSRASPWPRDPTHIPCVAGGFFTADPPGKPVFNSATAKLFSSSQPCGRD